MGGYTTYIEKREWEILRKNGFKDCHLHPVASPHLETLTTLTNHKDNKFDYSKLSYSTNTCSQQQQSQLNSKQMIENKVKSKQQHHVSRKLSTKSNLEQKLSQTTNRNQTISKDLLKPSNDGCTHQPPKHPPPSQELTSTVIENLKLLLDEKERAGSELKFIVIEEAMNSKKSAKSKLTEDKSVQADWAMVLDTRDDQRGNQDLHSSTPNLSDEKGTNIRKVRRSVSDSEEDEERHRAFSKTQRLIDDSRQREDNLIAHLGDYRSRLEQLHRMIALRDSNIGRLEAEICRLREVLVECRGKEKEMQSLISDLQLNLGDHEAQYDEDMTLGQLREAELRHTIDELAIENRRLKTENTQLNMELLKCYNQNANLKKEGAHLSIDNGQSLLNTRQSRSYDALSTTTMASPNNDQQDWTPLTYQTSKPTDQKVFLNGRIIMSHSTNLRQIFRLHGDFLNCGKNRGNRVAEECNKDASNQSKVCRNSEKVVEQNNKQDSSNSERESVDLSQEKNVKAETSNQTTAPQKHQSRQEVPQVTHKHLESSHHRKHSQPRHVSHHDTSLSHASCTDANVSHDYNSSINQPTTTLHSKYNRHANHHQKQQNQPKSNETTTRT